MARYVGLRQVRFQFRLHSEYIRSEDNVLADALSRSGTKPYRDIFRDHCRSVGGIPRERVVSLEHFNFDI